MAEGDVYLSVAALASALRLGGSEEDAEATRAIAAASRTIDAMTDRYFWDAGVVSTKRFLATTSSYVDVDDFQPAGAIVEVAGVAKAEGVDYYFSQPSAVYEVAPPSGWPWSRIVFPAGGLVRGGFPNVSVTARWGWETVPAAIEQATQHLAVRLFRRRGQDARASEFDALQVARTDPDVMNLVRPFMRHSLAIG